MRRRLDLAMTLVGEPRLIFLDEPTTGLDPRSRRTMWQIIGELVADGITIFLTTQHLDEADRLADRIAVLDFVGLVLMGGQFTAFTYLTPFLGTVTGITGGRISAFLLAFGIAAAAGTFAGGRAADKSATTTLVIANVGLIGSLAALYLGARARSSRHSRWPLGGLRALR